MIARIIAFSIRRRGLVILASLALAVLGLLAIRETPVDAIPDLSEDGVIVFADWPGHSPREVEDQVTYPLALELHGLRGVRSVRSSSVFHNAIIHLILDGSLTVAEGRRRVLERLGRAGAALPPGVVPKLGPDSPATGQIFWYTVEGKGLDAGRLRSLQDWYVRPRRASVEGVAEVARVGGFPVEYQVSVVPYRLQARGVTLAAVLEAISKSNATVGGHSIQKGNAEYVVRGVGRLGASSEGGDASSAIVRDLEAVLVPGPARGAPCGWVTWRRSPSVRGLAGVSWRRTAARRSAAWSRWPRARIRWRLPDGSGPGFTSFRAACPRACRSSRSTTGPR